MIDYVIESFLKGGIVIVPILLSSVCIWAIFLDLYQKINNENKHFFKHQEMFIDLIENRELSRQHETKSNYHSNIHKTCDFLIESIEKGNIMDMTSFENEIRIVKLQYFQPLQRKLKTITLFAIICPLLGLLGTVLGMMQTFSVLCIYGNSNPIILSDGVATAMITTKAGLIAAFPAMLLFAYLKNKLSKQEKYIDQIFNAATNYLTKKGKIK